MYKIIDIFERYYYDKSLYKSFPKWSDDYGEYYLNTMYCRIDKTVLVKSIRICQSKHKTDSVLNIFNENGLTILDDNITYNRCLNAFIWAFKKIDFCGNIVILGTGRIGKKIASYLDSINANYTFSDTRINEFIKTDLLISATNLESILHVEIEAKYVISFDGGYSVNIDDYKNYFTEYPEQLMNNFTNEFPQKESKEFLEIPKLIPANSFVYLYGFALFDLLTYENEKNN